MDSDDRLTNWFIDKDNVSTVDVIVLLKYNYYWYN